jgi:D-glycero-D-manno-heptose 1,7-bisphosphate phosphatase
MVARGVRGNRAVFLDRDGVINEAVIRDGKPCPPANLAELRIAPGVPQAVQQLREAGFVLIVVTNQPDVARGTTLRETVEQIHAQLGRELGLDAFRVCYHDNVDNCDCRKPRPGLLLDAAREFQIDMARSFMIGDRWRDMEAGQSAGCRTIFVDYAYDERQPTDYDWRVSSLAEAAAQICRLRD